MVTYTELFSLGMLIVGIINLVIQLVLLILMISKKK